MTDLVYVAYGRSDYEAVKDLDDYPCPNQPNGLIAASVVPRVGDYVRGDDLWWRVDVVAWSQHAQLRHVHPSPGGIVDYHAWVDVAVTPYDGDPRNPEDPQWRSRKEIASRSGEQPPPPPPGSAGSGGGTNEEAEE
jgi:hypothetical protein